MRAVIGGLRYDTTKAVEVADYSNGLGGRDFRNVSEALYKTRSGRFFLAGEGGPMTKYARAYGDMTGGGSGIIPMTPDEARGWCETHNVDADVIALHFAVTDA